MSCCCCLLIPDDHFPVEDTITAMERVTQRPNFLKIPEESQLKKKMTAASVKGHPSMKMSN
jgi:hypothetical protein